MQIIIISDGSTDHTVELANRAVENIGSESKVVIIAEDERKGKTNIINKAMNYVTGDLVIFSDTNVMLDENCITNLVYSFSDPKVGSVAGQLYYTNTDNTSASESAGLYWKYEEFIKKYESVSGSMMGADGSLFSIRKELYRKLPLHVLDDFCTSMGAIIQGYKLVFNESAKAYEKSAERSSEEFSRKIRISNRSFNSFIYLLPSLLKMDLINLLKFTSHKLLRWFTFPLMMAAISINFYLFLISENTVYVTIFYMQLIFYIIAFFGLNQSFIKKIGFIGKLINIIHYFVFSNIATFIGVMKALLGRKISFWNKAESTR